MTIVLSRRAFFAGAAMALAGSAALALAPTEVAAAGLTSKERRLKVLKAALKFEGQAVGRGECTDFVAAVLDKLKYKHDGFVWGRDAEQILPGRVLQFWNTKFDWGNGWWETTTQHTAIVVEHSTKTGRTVLIHQNSGGNRFVLQEEMFMNNLVRGSFEIFQPG